jgi:hypothetical protein
MGLTPDQIAIAVSLADPQYAAGKLKELNDKAIELEKQKQIKLEIKADAKDALANVQGWQVAWTDAQGKVQTSTVLTGDIIQKTYNDAGEAIRTVNGDVHDADESTKGFQITVKNLDGSTATVTIKDNAKDVMPGIEGVQRLVHNMDGTYSIVTLQANDQASGKIDEVKRKADALNGTRALLEIGYAVATGGPIPGVQQADGGIVKYYAGGGFESHVAQMAPSGVTRVWNEPETGGEAYIPLAGGKRGRSTEVLRQTADMFGYSLVPKGDRGHHHRAGGGHGNGRGGGDVNVRTTLVVQGSVYGDAHLKRQMTSALEAHDRSLALELRRGRES